MSQPQYFLPNLTRAQLAPEGRLSRAILKSRAIDDVFADSVGAQDCFISDVLGNGPGGTPGVILCYQRAGDGALPASTGFHPEHQRWTAIFSDSLWIGIDSGAPPTEEDLRRRRMIPGYDYPLREGEAWHIPIIRQPNGGTGLPTEMYFDTAGNLCEPVKEPFRSYWEESAETAGWFYPGEGGRAVEFSKPRGLELATHAMGLNYRFGNNEQALLKIIGSDNLLLVLGFTIDLPKSDAVEAAQKKTELAPSQDIQNFTPGPQDD